MLDLATAFNKRKALIPFITAGDPSLTATEKLVYQLEKAGADIIELGIPFSDPLADGPIIQASHQRALKNEVSLLKVFKLVAKIRQKSTIPLCFMLSYNLILRYGSDKFYHDCQKRGVNGVIVPDLPVEEMGEKAEAGVGRVILVAPTSTDERLRKAVAKASGFIYLISVTGITGKQKKLAANLATQVARIREYTNLPIAIGFGISNPAQAAAASRLANGVIVGSALVDLIGKQQLTAVPKLVAKFRNALDAT